MDAKIAAEVEQAASGSAALRAKFYRLLEGEDLALPPEKLPDGSCSTPVFRLGRHKGHFGAWVYGSQARKIPATQPETIAYHQAAKGLTAGGEKSSEFRADSLQDS